MRQFFIKLSQFNLALKQLILLLNITFLMIACGGGDDDSSPDPEPVVNNPTAATLIFPESNSECTEGTNITATESTIEFKWSGAMYADTYSLELKDLSAGSVTKLATSNTKIAITIKRGTPYSWSVISKSNKISNTAKSSTNKFYNAGVGAESYAPFPAELIAPEMGAQVEGNVISLDWSGSDIDNDIESYDVYFGESKTLEIHSANVKESILNNVEITSGKTYYWKVKTKDATGNVSTSDVFSFKGI
jgi:hypothetical protein